MLNRLDRCRSIRRSIKQRGQEITILPFHELQLRLPSPSICRIVVEQYLVTLDPIYRVVHVPTFLNTFEHNINQLHEAPLDFALKLCLVLAIGSVFCSESIREKLPLALIPHWIYAAQLWLNGPSEKSLSSESTIQIWCLLLLARLTTSTGSKEQSLSLAQAMLGLA